MHQVGDEALSSSSNHPFVHSWITTNVIWFTVYFLVGMIMFICTLGRNICCTVRLSHFEILVWYFCVRFVFDTFILVWYFQILVQIQVCTDGLAKYIMTRVLHVTCNIKVSTQRGSGLCCSRMDPLTVSIWYKWFRDSIWYSRKFQLPPFSENANLRVSEWDEVHSTGILQQAHDIVF